MYKALFFKITQNVRNKSQHILDEFPRYISPESIPIDFFWNPEAYASEIHVHWYDLFPGYISTYN